MADVNVRVRTTEDGSQSIKRTEASLKGLLDTAKNLSAGLIAMGATFKKALDFAEEGANINQLEESFGRLNNSTLHQTNLLGDLRSASRGTISDAQLMQGVLKLTAGASDELSQSFAEAAPRLLEIAKAANKLNPQLGDTAFLYDSISTGIKRSSPLILDNLGIIVKIGEANEAMAESLGKTVEQLSAEEKQMALLNATLEAGDQLINQVGGSIDSQADSYARLRTQVDELANSFKQWLGSGLLPTVQILGNDYGRAVEGIIQNNIDAAEGFDELVTRVERLRDEMGGGLKAALMGTLDEMQVGLGDTITAAAMSADTYEQWADAMTGVFGDVGGAWQALVTQMEREGTLGDFVNQGIDTPEEWFEFVRAQQEAAEAAARVAREVASADAVMTRYAITAGEATTNLTTLKDEVDALTQSDREYTYTTQANVTAGKAAAEAYTEQADALDELSEAEDEAAEAADRLRRAQRQAFGGDFLDSLGMAEDETVNFGQVMLEAAAAAGAGRTELVLLAAATGDYSEAQIEAAIQTAAMIEKAQMLGQAVANNEMSVGQAIEAFEEFQAQLDEDYTPEIDDSALDSASATARTLKQDLEAINGTYTANVQINTMGSVPSAGGGYNLGAGGGPNVQDRQAHGTDGAWLTVPPGYPNDSYLVAMSSGEQYNVARPGQQAGGGQTVVYQDNSTHVYRSREAAALGLAQAHMERRRRLNTNRGRG